MRTWLPWGTAAGLMLASGLILGAGGQSAAMLVRVQVARSCAVAVQYVGSNQASVSLTCSRGASTGVVTADTAAGTRIVPLPTRETTVVATRRSVAEPASPDNPGNPDSTPAPTHQVITINF